MSSSTAMLLDGDIAVNCSCSITLALTFNVVQLWGIVSNTMILVILVRSRMIRENTGKMLANEAVCDILVNMAAGAMATANLFHRRIAVIGVPIITSLSCVRAYCLLGISFVLYMAICHSLKYRYYVTSNRTIAYALLVWCLVPVVLLVIYLEGTFYARKERYGFVQIHYTSSNWWVGIFISFNACILPFVGIVTCVYKTVTYSQNVIFPAMYANSGSLVKIRLAKMAMLASFLHLLSQVPGQMISGLHVTSPVGVAIGYMLTFVYPSCKFFIYVYILRNFRKTAKYICRCFCKGSAVNPTQNRPLISILATSDLDRR
ncbi:melatonin receptor type 1A-like [Gigantopelta aegis]|uniref:melatonin receptor type 1A-like n=1 Tax=Gigantopelta aegis TaxID=1735272 RepID=UPI001B88B616|nr:melatonin receptor type 1A-like [Gigantopelta aegis]